MKEAREKTGSRVEVITSGPLSRGPSQKQVDDVIQGRSEKAAVVTRYLAERRSKFGLLKRTALFLVFENPRERED